jgi:hypothetical protein
LLTASKAARACRIIHVRSRGEPELITGHARRSLGLLGWRWKRKAQAAT